MSRFSADNTRQDSRQDPQSCQKTPAGDAAFAPRSPVLNLSRCIGSALQWEDELMIKLTYVSKSKPNTFLELVACDVYQFIVRYMVCKVSEVDLPAFMNHAEPLQPIVSEDGVLAVEFASQRASRL